MSNNTFKDQAGTTYIPPSNQPASHGTKVQIYTNTGVVSGTMVGGYVRPDERK